MVKSMKPLFQKKVATHREIRPLFQPLESDEELLRELSTDQEILETLETFRDDDLLYSSMKVPDRVKSQIYDLRKSLWLDDHVDHLKVCSLFSLHIFIYNFFIPEFLAVSAEKKSPG